MIGPIEVCILCGLVLHADMEKRYKQVQYVAALVRDACIPSPYVYEHIMRRARDEKNKLEQQRRQRAPARWEDSSRAVLPAIVIDDPLSCAPAATPLAAAAGGSPSAWASPGGLRLLQGPVFRRPPKRKGTCLARGPVWWKRRATAARGCGGSASGGGGDSSESGRHSPTVGQGFPWSVGGSQSCSSARSERVPLCIACINWVRRLSQQVAAASAKCLPRCGERGAAAQVKAKYIPLDNLFLFAHDPGGFPEPDKRCMQRLLQNLCVEYCGESPLVCIRNPYRCFETPIISRVLSIYKRKWFPNFRLDCRDRSRWRRVMPAPLLLLGDEPLQQASSTGAHQGQQRQHAQEGVGGRTCVPRAVLGPSQNGCAHHADVIYDVIYAWWVCTGMLYIMENRRAARYVRKMLKIGGGDDAGLGR